MSRLLRLTVSVSIALVVLASCKTVQELPVAVADETTVFSTDPATTETSGVVASEAEARVTFNYESPILQVLSNAFSPNGDGYRDTLDFYAAIPTTQGFASWELTLLSEGHREVIKVQGTRLIPGSFTWDGKTFSGEDVPDGWYYGRLTVRYEGGAFVTAHSSEFLLLRTGPRAHITVPQGYFSPDGDGVNDTITVKLDVDDPDSVVSYQVTLYDSRNSVFETYAAPGLPPAEFTWDGTNRLGETVESAEDYRIELTLKDSLGNTSVSNAMIPVDILVYQDGDQLKIRTSAITFLAYSANYMDVPPDQRAKNLATLDRLAEVLKKFQSYNIEVQGHAVQIYWNDPVRGRTEQSEVLIPLSQARAEAIVAALIARGVNPARLTAVGVGGAQPIVPFSNLEDRWRNRRVEFILHK